MRMLHPKTLASDVTSSGLLPSLDRHSGILCRSHGMFYLLYVSGLLRQHGGEGVGNIIVHVSLMSRGVADCGNSPLQTTLSTCGRSEVCLNLRHLEMSKGVNNCVSFLINLTWP